MTQNARIAQLVQTSTRTRIVHDRRWIDSADLELGMYVCQLDRPWSDTPFLFQGFRLDTCELLQQVRQFSERVEVETEKLARLPGDAIHRSRVLSGCGW